MTTTDAVQFPAKAIGVDPGSDLSQPLKNLLQGLGILPLDADIDGKNGLWALTGTPQSVAILEAGATALSKWWSVVVGALGGSAAVAAGVAGFWSGQSDLVRVAFVAGGAVILASVAIAVALMVRTDIRSRTEGQVMLYEVRRALTVDFLDKAFQASAGAICSSETDTSADDSSRDSSTVVALAAARSRAAVTHLPTGTTGHLSGIRQVKRDIELQYQRDSDNQVDWCRPSDLTIREFSFEA